MTSHRKVRAMVRELQLRELGYASYAAYLKSAAWSDVRDRYKASDLPQLCMCGATSWELHHTTYERVGRERLEDLTPLCRTCHADAHAFEAAGATMEHGPSREVRHSTIAGRACRAGVRMATPRRIRVGPADVSSRLARARRTTWRSGMHGHVVDDGR